ncbi:putative quinol monooxygenase [Aquipseudomonas campi]
MIDVIAEIRTTPGTRQHVLDAIHANLPAVLAEAGCLAYRPSLDLASGLDSQHQDTDSLVILEQWQSLEHLHAHLATPHMQAYHRQVADWVIAVRLRVLGAA